METSGTQRSPASAEEPTSAAQLTIVVMPWRGSSGRDGSSGRGSPKSRFSSRRISQWIRVAIRGRSL